MLTELDIINDMLASTGTAPLTSNDYRHPAYKKANQKLERVMLKVQAKGWWFNKSKRTFKINSDGEIILPSNTLHADPVRKSDNYIVRRGKLFQPDLRSFVFDGDVQVWFVENLSIDDMPPTAAEYIRAKAVYDYYLDAGGTEPKLSKYENAKMEAWVDFKDEHLKNADLNFFDGTSQQERGRGYWYRNNRLPVTDS